MLRDNHNDFVTTLLIHAFDNEFWKHDFDIFKDGQNKTHNDGSLLNIDTEKLESYFVPEILLERLENGIESRFAARFENCNSSKFDFDQKDVTHSNYKKIENDI